MDQRTRSWCKDFVSEKFRPGKLIILYSYRQTLFDRMFGASIVRQKRERERRERLARGDPPIIPYIKPFGERFDQSQLPYFKYRQAMAQMGQGHPNAKVSSNNYR